MKKLLTIFTLLCVSVVGWSAATQYCDYALVNGTHTVYFSAYKVSEGNYQIKITSTEDMDGLSAGCYMYVNGDGYQMLPHSTVSADKKTITVDIAGTPGRIYNPLYIMMPGEVTFAAVQNVDIDWSATCSSGDCTDETAPTVSSVSTGSITHNSVVLTVTASDNNGGTGISRYIVKNGDSQIASSTTSPITVTGLSAGTTYNNIKVIAKDGCNNESSAYAVSSFTTENRPSECSGDLGHFASPSTKRISYTIEYYPIIDKIKYTVRGYNTEVLTYLEIQTTQGYSGSVDVTDGVAVWFQNAPASGTEMAIRFLYGVSSIGDGREMNSQNVDLNDAQAVYYKSHDCSVASAPTTVPDAPTDKNDCQVYSIFGTDGFSSHATRAEAWDGAKSYLTGKINGKDVYFTTAGTTANIQYPSLNINAYDKLHFDIWTDAAREIGVELCINAGTHGSKQNITTTASGWKSVDLDLTGFHADKNVSTTFFFLSSLSRATYYVANAYLYKTAEDESCYADCGINVALGKYSEAGCSPGDGNNAAKANDGADTEWQTGANADYANQWWYVDLGKAYNLDKVTITFENARTNHFFLQGRIDAPTAEQKANDAAWTTLREVTDLPLGGYALNTYDVSGKAARYVRFKSLSNEYNNAYGCKIREFSVCVTGLADIDTEKPSMTSATLDSYTDSRAVISVAATDNKGIANYHVVASTHSIDENLSPADGKITITGLTAGTAYTFVITAVDFFGNESDNSKSVSVTTSSHLTAPAAAATAPTWDASLVKAIYSPTYSADCNFQAWGSNTVYTQDTYGKKYAVGTSGYFGMDNFTLNCVVMEKLHADIWIADDASLRLVPIYGGSGLDTDDTHGKAVNLVGQQWNSIDLDLATDYAGLNLASIFQFKIDQATNLTFWIGNLYFYRETAIVDSEAPTNVSASLTATGFYSVLITAQASDNSGVVNFSVRNGAAELATASAASGVATTITVNSLTPGSAYNLNVVAYDDAGNEAAPVAVQATTNTLPASAPVDLNGKKVIPVFTDAVEGGKTNISSGGWGESTIVQWLNLTANDKVFYAQNFNWAGWHSWGADIDATNMLYLHVDIYSLGMTSVSITPISHDPTHEGSAAIALTPNAWTSADIALSTYDAANIEWNKIFQFKFANPVGGNEFMADNVYFWQYGAKSNVDKWATFAAPVDVKVPSGVTVYKAAHEVLGGEEVLRLTEIASGVIPANTGALLQCETESTTYAFSLATSDEAADAAVEFSGNSLVGCAVKTDISAVAATHDIYALRHSDAYGFSGFFLYSGTVVNAGKAYLPLEKDPGTPAPSRSLRFVYDTATGVENSQPAAIGVQKVLKNGQLYILRDNVTYTIQGVRVE